MEDGGWIKKFRTLTLALIFSGALNIGLLATLVVFAFQSKEEGTAIPSLARSAGEQPEGTLPQTLRSMSQLSFRELVSFLTNRDLVEEGYTKGDLAVAGLVAFHHFNLEKALSGTPAQRRVVALTPERQIEVFPGLNEEQFQAIIRFAYEEKWPLDAEGLFALLKKSPVPRDESLVQAFQMTPEFYALQTLFQKTEAPQENGVLLELISEGGWDLMDRFAREQSQMLDLSVEKRRRLLLSYLSMQSAAAADLLVRTDFSFVAKKLDDRGILDLLKNLQKKSPEAERFCSELLRSSRSDAVWQTSAEKLYGFAGEAAPLPFDLKVAQARFAPQALVEGAPKAVAAKVEKGAPKYHTVQKGESLWKIAHKYGVKVDELVKVNEIDKDHLYPGMTLKIP